MIGSENVNNKLELLISPLSKRHISLLTEIYRGSCSVEDFVDRFRCESHSISSSLNLDSLALVPVDDYLVLKWSNTVEGYQCSGVVKLTLDDYNKVVEVH